MSDKGESTEDTDKKGQRTDKRRKTEGVGKKGKDRSRIKIERQEYGRKGRLEDRQKWKNRRGRTTEAG